MNEILKIIGLVGIYLIAGLIFINLVIQWQRKSLLKVLRKQQMKLVESQRKDLFDLILFNPATINQIKENSSEIKKYMHRFPVITIYENEGLEKAAVMLGGLMIKKLEENNELLKKITNELDVIESFKQERKL